MEDEEIIDLYFERSEQAIAETEAKYGTMCLAIANNIVLNKEDAEECVNDVYMGLWTAIPPSRPHALPAFIAKITRNIAMNKITYANAQKRSVKSTVPLEEIERGMYYRDEISEIIEKQELSNQIEIFLRNQTYENRNVFLRRYWFMDSVSEISERFLMSESSVRRRLVKTKKKLEEYLIKEGYML